jgi:hypothetical protein
VNRLDGLRPPTVLDAEPALYKDWLHLKVFAPGEPLVALVNVALHGAPGDAKAVAVGTALAHTPGEGWTGGVEVEPLAAAGTGEEGVRLPGVALALDPVTPAVLASARLPGDALDLDLVARPAGRALVVPWRLRLGDGWVSWAAIARLAVEGRATVAGREADLGGAQAYHDHNWGRWRWGDDVGWRFGCFAVTGGPTLTLCWITDREHRRRQDARLHVHGERRRGFAGASVAVEYEGKLAPPARRLPGALAALHGDRARPRLPARVAVEADDGADHLRIEFDAAGAVQLIVPEIAERGYGFIHELAGSFRVHGRLGGKRLSGGGLGVFEHVD